MGKNDLSNSENILVKVDQNNLIYVDPNSVLVNGQIEPRNINQEKLVMYVNLEADIIPRSILTAGENKDSLTSIAKGTLNFLGNQSSKGKEFTTDWTEAFLSQKEKIINGKKVTENTSKEYYQNDESGQSFGIDSISISVKGANFIPQVNINFIDVRGKTLFEAAENSPYKAFFHIPWPIFYLTVKGYFGKAIRYRLHLIKFNTRFNEGNGNFEVATTFVGSTYAFMNDIPLKGIINAPYMYIRESTSPITFNGRTGLNEQKVSKTSKGYTILNSVYQEMKQKKLIPQNFPVKTLKEIGVIAKSLDRMLEKEIFDEVIDMKVLSGLKDYEDTVTTFEKAIKGWGTINLSTTEYEDIDGIRYYTLKQNKTSTSVVLGNQSGTLEKLILDYSKKLNDSVLFNKQLQKTGTKGLKYNFRSKTMGNVNNYFKNPPYSANGSVKVNVVVAIDQIVSDIFEIRKTFNEEKNKIEKEVERKMNEVIKDKSKGIGFDPTVRNLFAVLLANAEVYVRLMKDVHEDAFLIANERKNKVKNLDDESIGESIYPWPEIKKTVPNSKHKVIAYPGEPELQKQLQSNNRTLWPEVEFVEEFISVTTNRTDPLVNKENGVNDIQYIFESDLDKSRINEISSLYNITNVIPYSDRTLVSFLYEIYERAKQLTLLESFTTETIRELVEIEFKTIQEVTTDEIDIVDILRTSVNSINKLREYMAGFSPFERYPYYQDSIPTTTYIKNVLEEPYSFEQYVYNPETSKSSDNTLYQNLNNQLSNYVVESYRKNIYPYSSQTYLNYLNKQSIDNEELKLNGVLQVDVSEGFICSPVKSVSWIKDGFDENIFSNKLRINTTETNILNTPYFHKQLYSDFITNQSGYGKYVGSAYLLLNSLPFHDLEDNVIFTRGTDGGVVGYKPVRLTTILKEVGATHFLPYHLLVKWGSIYHRYKKYILEGTDILTGFTTSSNNTTTTSVDGNLFFNNNETGNAFTAFTINSTGVTYSGNTDVGIHPYYDAIFHQVVNGYLHYNVLSGNTSFSANVTSGAINSRPRVLPNGLKYWTSFVDNSKYSGYQNDLKYTLLPCDGDNSYIDKTFTLTNQNPGVFNIPITINVNTDSFEKGVQNYLRCVWEDDFLNDNFSGRTFPDYRQYNRSYQSGTTKTYDNQYSIYSDYRKIIDLVGTFSPKILEQMEEMFLQFASERVVEEIPYKRFSNVKYDNFQDLLKELVTVDKKTGDSTDINVLIKTLKDRQKEKLKSVTNDIVDDNNLIKFKIGNPKELDSYILEGFVGIADNTFTYNEFNVSQTGNTTYIKLYVGEDVDGYYEDFFTDLDVELSEENVLLFRPLILIYAGYRKSGGTNTKQSFISYLTDNILAYSPSENGIGGSDYRLSLFLTLLTQKFSGLEVKTDVRPINFVDGYNNRTLKIELYNFFKSFNDKWSAGNSIGQRLLLEEFLFLDKANKDIGDKAYLNLNKFISILDTKNDKSNLYGAVSMLIQGTDFDMRALPAYVNFYGTNFSSKSKITPSKRVAENVFGTFLDVDYQESSPKIIIQYTGPTSKHLDLAENKKSKYKFSDDSFNIANVNNNPLIVTLPTVFNTEELQKSNKVVAFEVSFGDQYQGIFKGVQLDQSSIRNTTESFVVLENLARSESGSGAYNVDIGLFEYYRQASYSCEVKCMGNVMIQPTMFFYLKNIPMFRGTYWITEVSHEIRGNNISTTFKGTRIPVASLPDPEDSFISSYRPLFDKIINKARILQNSTGSTSTQISISTSYGNFITDPGSKVIPGEKIFDKEAEITPFGIPYNGYGNERYIQKVSYKNQTWYRAVVARMGSSLYEISDDTHMSLVGRLRNTVVKDSEGKPKLTWGELKEVTEAQRFYSARFQFTPAINADKIISGTSKFLNPQTGKEVSLQPLYELDRTTTQLAVRGPVNIGPNIDGYGVGMSYKLMNELGLHEGDVVYFNIE